MAYKLFSVKLRLSMKSGCIFEPTKMLMSNTAVTAPFVALLKLPVFQHTAGYSVPVNAVLMGVPVPTLVKVPGLLNTTTLLLLANKNSGSTVAVTLKL